METKHNHLLILETLLILIFSSLWMGIVTGKIHNVRTAWVGLKENMHVQKQFASDPVKVFMQRACGELVPSLPGSEFNRYTDLRFHPETTLFLPIIRELIQKETFPVQRYSIDYWKGSGAYQAKYSDTVPDYFLESDETNEEPKKKDPGIMPGNGSGKTYSLKKLSDRDYLLNHFYIVDETTSMSSEETNAGKLLRQDLSLSLPREEPLVLIYHTHGSESYRSEKGKSGTVIDVGEALKKELEEKYNIPVIHDTTVYDQINGELDRSLAYNYAADSVSEILKKNPGIEVILDLHRDSISESHHLVTEINGRKTAQIMFFNGVSRRNGVGEIDYLENPNKLSNLSFSLQLQLLAAKYYPGFTRKIYIKGYRYNLHLKKRAALIEVGAQNNTVTEAENSMKPLAELLYRLLKGEKAYKSSISDAGFS